MDLGISGKTAFVAASTGGLGLAIARALAAEGVRVAITGRRGDRAKEIVAELHATACGPGAVAIEADLSTAGARGRRRRTDSRGTRADRHPGAQRSRAEARRRRHARAPTTSPRRSNLLVKPHHALVSHDRCRACGNARWGRILAVGSSGVAAPLPNLALSNTGRAALAGYLKTLAAEVALDGVTVNMLLPGRIATDRVAATGRGRRQTARHARSRTIQLESRKTIPARRYGEPGGVRRRRRVPLQRPGLVHHRRRAALRRRPGPQPASLHPSISPKEHHDFHSTTPQ